MGFFMKNIFILLFVFVFFVSALHADKIYNDELTYFEYERTIDGDTFVISIKNIHALFGDNISVRIRGINSPEKKEKGYNESRKALKKILGDGSDMRILNLSRGKFFRLVADIYVGDVNVAEYMIKNNYAEVYEE